jgi:hypothetical protein
MDFDEEYFKDRQKSGFERTKMYQKDFNYSIKSIEKLKPTGKISIMDIGCADGEFTERFSKIANLYGVEINLQEANKASLKGIKIVNFQDIDLVKPDVVILRGTLQHISPEDFFHVLSYRPKMLILLQTPNPQSFVYRILDQSQISLLTPHEGFRGNLNLISLKQLKKIAKNEKYRITRISKPYFSTPYCYPIKDLTQLILCFLNRNITYTGSWKGNIYRMTMIGDVAVD